MKKLTLVLLLALLVALPAAAEKRDVDITEPAAPDGTVTIELIAGSVEVIGWERDQVRVTGTIDDDYAELDVDADEDEVSIEVELKDGRRHGDMPAAKLRVQAPSGSRLEIEVISGDIYVDGITGETEIESVSGKIEVAAAMRELEVACISGGIRVKATTALDEGSFETVSGDIEFRGPIARKGRLSFESVNGEITLRLPSDTSAQFDVETFNGSIENDFGPSARRTSEFLPAQQLSFSTGGGDARVTAESFNGAVRLLRE